MTVNDLIKKLQELPEDKKNYRVDIYKYDYTDIPVECNLEEEDIQINECPWDKYVGLGC